MSTSFSVIDTNVLLVARGRHDGVSAGCVATCIHRLIEIQQSGRFALDDGNRIIQEYLNKTDPRRGNDVGQTFLKWLLRHQRNPKRCVRVTIVEHPQLGFESFPSDPDLAHFDPADRKFVAVAAACSERPPILQAADAKWLGWAAALARHDVLVDFLCRDDVERFRTRKQPR
jgi:hypothetical protein